MLSAAAACLVIKFHLSLQGKSPTSHAKGSENFLSRIRMNDGLKSAEREEEFERTSLSFANALERSFAPPKDLCRSRHSVMFLIDVARAVADIGSTSPEKKSKEKITIVCRIDIDRTNVIDEQCSRINQIDEM